MPDASDLIFKEQLARIEADLARQMDVTFQSNPFRSLDRRFMILFGARCGSHLLCEGLLEHGAVANAFFHPKRIEKAAASGSTLQAYYESVLREKAIGGTFGVKGGTYILAHLSLAGEFPDFLSEWGIVFLKRENLVRQAISRVVGQLTGSWASYKAPKRALTDDDFDPRRIASMIKGCDALNNKCEDVFRVFDLNPLRLTYEELAADQKGVVARVAEHLGLHGPPITDQSFIKPKVEVQGTDLNARWEARFRAEEAWRLEETPTAQVA